MELYRSKIIIVSEEQILLNFLIIQPFLRLSSQKCYFCRSLWYFKGRVTFTSLYLNQTGTGNLAECLFPLTVWENRLTRLFLDDFLP